MWHVDEGGVRLADGGRLYGAGWLIVREARRGVSVARGIIGVGRTQPAQQARQEWPEDATLKEGRSWRWQ